MELKIYSPTEEGFVKAIDWNHKEIKKDLTERVKKYNNMVYTDETIKEAKADRAALNKFAAALDEKRKEVKKQCLAPYETFEKQMKEIIQIINEPIQLIDQQVKNYEQRLKDEKQEEITKILEEVKEQLDDELKSIEIFFDARWLNASISLKKVREDIETAVAKINTEYKSLDMLPDFSFEEKEYYLRTQDISGAIAECKRLSDISEKKAAYEAEKKRQTEEKTIAETREPVEECPEVDTYNDCGPAPCEMLSAIEEAKQWIAFKALLNTEDANALAEFFSIKNIEYKAI